MQGRTIPEAMLYKEYIGRIVRPLNEKMERRRTDRRKERKRNPNPIIEDSDSENEDEEDPDRMGNRMAA